MNPENEDTFWKHECPETGGYPRFIPIGEICPACAFASLGKIETIRQDEYRNKVMEDQLKKIIATHLGIDKDSIRNNMSFIDDLGADSLDTVELVMAIEEEFETEVPDEVAENLHTVQNMLDYLAKSG